MTPDQLPASFRRVTLVVAREHEPPEGEARDNYLLTAPLLEDGRVDGETCKAHRPACRVVHNHDDLTAIGHLVHGPGGQWRLHYDIAGEIDDEVGYRLADERRVAGEYVSIKRGDDIHPYRVTAVTPVI